MQFNRCMKCLKEIKGYPCPECGYAGEVQLEFALKQGFILNGRYVVGCVLGQGNFGITYVGWDLALEIKVAIKEYYPRSSVCRNVKTGSKLTWFTTKTAEKYRRNGMDAFLREAWKMAKIDRIPGAVRVRDVFLANETAYIVMDYAEGQTLKSLLQKSGSMDWAAAEKIFLPALQTLSQVHKAGIIHRDIRPDNLMIAFDGTVQLLDLGVPDFDYFRETDIPVISRYSPVERYMQHGSGPWTDVYSMGATIYSAVTGKVPPSPILLGDGDFDWVDLRLKELPANVLAALKKALQLRAQDRYQSADAFLAALKEEQKTPKPDCRQQCTVYSEEADRLGVRAGDYINFGHYWQDIHSSNGKKAIEWLVLDVQDGKALVLSRYGLDAKAYNTERVDITWEECTLRSWLNGEFLKAAFNSEEQSTILMTNVDNSACASRESIDWTPDGGNNTQDKIFLLSYAEASEYVGVHFYSGNGATNNMESRTFPTAYAKAQGAWTSDDSSYSDEKTTEGTACGWWWLRSPGYDQDRAAGVDCDGFLVNGNVDDASACVRPAFWINLDSGIF